MGLPETANVEPSNKDRLTVVENVSADARIAIDAEHNLTFKQALKLYPTAVFWSIFFTLGVIMAAFDSQVIGTLYATPAFQRDFGYLYEDEYIISAPWQTGLSMGSSIGQVVGAFFAAYPMEWFGRKYTYGACVVLTTGTVFIQFFARSLVVLLVGELLAGLIVGFYVVIAPAYASEVCPSALRGVLISCSQICYVTGQLIANSVLAGTSTLDSHWAYSAPFAVQWLWPAIILVALPFAPESPWWLQRQGRLTDAEKALKKLSSSNVDVKPILAMIIETDRLEREQEAGSTYVDCFKKANRRRTMIAVGVSCVQVLSGISLTGFVTYFFTLAGLPTSASFDMGIGFLACGFLGNCIGWVLIVYFGRRTLYLNGLAILAALQLIVGALDCAPNYESRPAIAWAQSVILVIWEFGFSMSLGPVCYVIFCEVSATTVRSNTIALATAAQAVLSIAMTVGIPYLVNPDQANGRGKIGFFFGGLAVLCYVWSWFELPESYGRTFEEIDVMFERGVKTRDFKRYVVHLESSGTETQVSKA